MPSLREFSIFLEQNVAKYSVPKRALEQYRTPPEIAVKMALRALFHNCRFCIDLGTGTGMLAYASALVLGSYVVGVDIDDEALSDAKGSVLYSRLIVDFVQGDVSSLPLRDCMGMCCVVQNPPFGMVRRSYDSLFVEAAASLHPVVILSIHHAKTDSEFLSSLYGRLGYSIRIVAEEPFLIPQIYERHRRKTFYTRVLVIEATHRDK